MLKIGDFSKLSPRPCICAPLTNPPPDGGGVLYDLLNRVDFHGTGGHNRAYYVRGRCGYGGEHHAGAVPVCA